MTEETEARPKAEGRAWKLIGVEMSDRLRATICGRSFNGQNQRISLVQKFDRMKFCLNEILSG
jgi:hypothetical protein